jgi:hypothetical protein
MYFFFSHSAHSFFEPHYKVTSLHFSPDKLHVSVRWIKFRPSKQQLSEFPQKVVLKLLAYTFTLTRHVRT